MGYKLEFNTILSIPDGALDLSSLTVGQRYTVNKPEERIFPLNIPIDLCGSDYIFIAKVAVRKLTLTEGNTELELDVIKLFDENESKIISENFAKHA